MFQIHFRSSRPDVFCKKDVLRNFAKFTGKHLCQILCFAKVAGLTPATLLKKRLWHRCFPVNFAKFLIAPFLTEHLRWLLLSFPLKTSGNHRLKRPKWQYEYQTLDGSFRWTSSSYCRESILDKKWSPFSWFLSLLSIPSIHTTLMQRHYLVDLKLRRREAN